MDFELTKEQKSIQKIAQLFGERIVEPLAAEIDREKKFSWYIFHAMQRHGMVGVSFPELYGGSGGDELSRVLVIEEMAKHCASTAVTLSVAQIAPNCILTYGTEEQKRFFVPPLLSGEDLSAFALTEPNAGSDASSLLTSAKQDGDYFILNGTKSFITGGALSRFIIVFARTGGPRKISAFIVEKGASGLSYGKPEEKLGINGSETVEVILKDCSVPKENMLGERDKGFNIAMTALDSGRIGIAAQSLGIAERVLQESVKYMRSRVQFGKPIGMQQGLSWYLSEMKARVEASRNLIYKAAWLKQKGLPFTMDAAIAKLYASETANFCAHKAVQIHGGYGFLKDFVLERFYRDAKVLEIYEGTSEINKLVIARSLLGPF
ncbi:MAG: acyl-CoA dehydrogenase family protein [Desulfarculales bacterium]|jgi:butyryl-CoA dehydrogenase|nr:acyl-CoA dehydrogenase family protein [Desulfarculales bacterium]